MKHRGWFTRNALGLWFLGIATLGFVRWWMETAREGAGASTPDVALWLVGSIVLALAGLVALWRSR